MNGNHQNINKICNEVLEKESLINYKVIEEIIEKVKFILNRNLNNNEIEEIENIVNKENINRICEIYFNSRNSKNGIITEKTLNDIIKKAENNFKRKLNDEEIEIIKNIVSEKKEKIEENSKKTRKKWQQNDKNQQIHNNKVKTENIVPKFLFENFENIQNKKFSDYVFYYKKLCEFENEEEIIPLKDNIEIFIKDFADYINKNQENLKKEQIINFFDFIRSTSYRFIENFDFLINLLTNELNEEIDLRKLNLYSLDIISYSPRSINKNFLKYLTRIIKLTKNNLNSIDFALLVKNLVNLDNITLEEDFFEAINILIRNIDDDFLQIRLIIDIANNLRSEKKYLPENFLEGLHKQINNFELNKIGINELRKLLFDEVENNQDYFDKIFGIIYLRKNEIGFKEAKAINSFFHKIPENFLLEEYKNLFEEILIENKDKINYNELNEILIFSNFIFSHEQKNRIKNIYKEYEEEKEEEQKKLEFEIANNKIDEKENIGFLEKLKKKIMDFFRK